MSSGRELVGWCSRLVVVTVALCWSRVAHAAIGEGELLARLSWLLLLPLGLVQVILAATMRRYLTGSRAGSTAFVAVLSIAAGILVSLFVEDRRAVGVIQASLALLPGLPVVVDLLRQKAWSASVLVVILLPVPVALIILEGAGR